MKNLYNKLLIIILCVLACCFGRAGETINVGCDACDATIDDSWWWNDSTFASYWTVTGARSQSNWITVKGYTNNGLVYIHCDANSSTSSRTGKVIMYERSSDGYSQGVEHTVVQAGVQCTLTCETTTFPETGGNGNIHITSDLSSWTVTKSASWVTLVVTTGSKSGDIGFHVASNETHSLRTALISVGGRSVTISQEPKLPCDIVFDANGGIPTPSPITRNIGSTYGELPLPTLTAKVFIGWFTALDGGSQITRDSTVDDDRVLYAHWKDAPYSVIYNQNYSGGTSEEKWFDENQAHGVLPAPTRSHYKLDGWYTEKTGGSKISTATIVTASVTVYAHWICDHADPDGEVTKEKIPPTCTEHGYSKEITCKNCGEIISPVVAEGNPLGHLRYYSQSAVAPTCVQTGSSGEISCFRCGARLQEQTTIQALGHVKGGSAITKAATATATGTRTFYCGRCNAAIWTETIPALGTKKSDGTYSDVVGDSTWTYVILNGEATIGDGSSAAIATTTTGEMTIPSVLGGCPVTAIATKAFYGCTKITGITVQDGVVSAGEYAFANCSSLTNLVFPASFNTFGNYAFYRCAKIAEVIFNGNAPSGSDVFYYSRSICQIRVKPSSSGWGDVPGTWQYGATSYITCPHAHQITTGATAANCTATGHTGTTTCLDCGVTISEGDVLPIVDIHRFTESIAAIKPTCTAAGRTHQLKCQDCQHIFEESEVLPALGHCPQETTAAVAATCTESGKTHEVKCSRCNTTLEPITTTPALGHNVGPWVDLGRISSTKGKRVRYCLRCWQEMDSEEYAIEQPKANGTYTETANGITWTYVINNGEAQVGTGGWGARALSQSTSGEVIVPSYLGGCKVTRIADSAFTAVTNMTSVVIPDTVTSIGSWTFRDCSSLTKMIVGKSVSSIGSAVLYCSSAVAEALFRGDAPSADNMFLYSRSAVVKVRKDAVGWGTVPGGWSYGTTAYYTCNHSRTRSIVERAATASKPGLKVRHCVECWEPVESFEYSISPADGTYTEVVNGIEWTYVISAGEASVGAGRFGTCSAIPGETGGEIEIPSCLGGCPVTEVGWCAFYGNTSITSVIIPDSVKVVQGWSFKDCSGISRVIMGRMVEYIDNWAFIDCGGLSEVTFRGDAPATGGGVFLRVASGCVGYVREDSTGFGNAPCSWNGLSIQYISCQHDDVRTDNAKPATCLSNGYTGDAVCSTCGSIRARGRVVAALGHHDVVATAIIEPTCTTVGKTPEHRCSRCGILLTPITDIPKVPHTPHETKAAIAPTCTTIGKSAESSCSVCGQVLEPVHDVAMIPHTEHIVTPQVNPTCTECGYRKVSECSVCGAILSTAEKIPATGHTEQITTQPLAATCTAKGHSKGSRCSVCGTILSTSTESAALGHVEGAPVVTTPPTATTAGVLSYPCERCNAIIRTESIPCASGGEDGYVWANATNIWVYENPLDIFSRNIMPERRTLVAAAKSNGGPYTEAVDSGTDAGVITWTFKIVNGNAILCSGTAGVPCIADDILGGDVPIEVPAVLGGRPVTEIGDSAFYGCMDLGSLMIPSTVTKINDNAFNGYSDGWGGNLIFKGDAPDLTSDALSGLSGAVFIWAPCDAEGWDSNGDGTWNDCDINRFHYTCRDIANPSSIVWNSHPCIRCGAKQTAAEKMIVHVEHEKTTTKASVAATCSSAGRTEGWRCNNCGKTQSSTTIPSGGHRVNVLSPAVAATCTTDGHNSISVCTECGAILTNGELLPKLGHIEYVSRNATAATCTTAGNTEETSCSRCGAVLVSAQVLSALGHVPHALDPVAPTEHDAGYVDKVICDRCGSTIREGTPTYSVVFDANGGSGDMTNMLYVTGTELQLDENKFTKNGYEFAGWSSTVNGAILYVDCGVVTNVLSGSGGYMCLYAKWRGLGYVVIFNANGGIGEMAAQELSYGQSQHLSKNLFTKTGYTFAGWSETVSGAQAYSDEGTILKSTAIDDDLLNLYAKWNPIKYYIEKVPYYTETVASNVVRSTANYDTAYRLDYLSGPSKTGYTFLGWSMTRFGDVEYAYGAMVSNLTVSAGATITFYGVWTNNHYQVAFNATGGQGEMSTLEEIYAVPFVLPANIFSRVGYEYTGWSTAANGSVAYGDGATVSNLTAVANGVATLYAKWTGVPYKVAFDANGGGGSMGQLDCVYGTSKKLTSNAFSKTGYAFSGWATEPNGAVVYANGATISNLTTEKNAVVTLYAKWTPNQYKIKFNANGGTGTMTDSTCAYDADLVLSANVFARSGYEFAGWATSPGGDVVYADATPVRNLTDVPNGNVTLYAVWTAKTYNVSLNMIERGLSVKYYDLTSAISTSTWYSNVDSYNEATAYLVSTTPNLSTNTLDLGDSLDFGHGYSTSSRSNFHEKYGLYGTEYFTVKIQGYYYAPSAGSYTFKAQHDDGCVIYIDGTSVYAYNSSMGSSSWRTFTVNLTEGYHEILIWFHEYSGYQFLRFQGIAQERLYRTIPSGIESSVVAATFDAPMPTVVVPERTGFTFDGYYTEADGNGVRYYLGDGTSARNWDIPNDTVLYVNWTRNTYAVFFDPNGGSGMMDSELFSYGESKALTSNAFTRTGYTFVGWAISSVGDVEYAENQSVCNLSGENDAVITLYAKWTKNGYAVAFDANGGVGSMDSVGMTYDESSILPTNSFVREGWTFVGWATTADGAVLYENAESVSNLSTTSGATVTLYAKWSKNNYTIAFNGNGATSGTMGNVSATYDQSVTLTANAFSRIGYQFSGWANTASGDVEYTDGATVSKLSAADGAVVTLYAAWANNSYTISFNANGGTGTTSSKTFYYDIEDTLPLNGFAREGYTFIGWAKTASGSVEYNDRAAVFNWQTENGAIQTLYAKWRINQYTIAYDPNGGSGSMGSTMLNYDAVQNLPANAFIKMGYTFIGWSDAPDGEVKYTNAQQIQKLKANNGGQIVLYAVWQKNVYEVVQPGFVTKTITGSSLVFDTTTDIWNNSSVCVDEATGLYVSSLAAHTTIAYGTYMYMESGVTYNFRGKYDDFAAVKIDSTWVIPKASSECAAVSGSYTAKSSGWRKIEFRVGNNGGAGGVTSSSYYGIQWKSSKVSSWQTIRAANNWPLFTVAPPVRVKNNPDDAVQTDAVNGTAYIHYMKRDEEREVSLWIDGTEFLCAEESGICAWQPTTTGTHLIKWVCGTMTASVDVVVASVAVPGPPEPNPPTSANANVTITQTTYHFGQGGGTRSINTTGTGTWAASASHDWITLPLASGAAGNPVPYTVLASNQAEPRTGYVYVSGHVFTITQDGVGAELDSDSAECELEGGDSVLTILADTHVTWSVRPEVDWISVSATSGEGESEITYTVAPWNEVRTRSGTITAAGKTFTVFQTGRRIKLSTYAEHKDYNSHILDIQVNAFSDSQWEIYLDNSWISVVDGGGGRGGDNVAVAINENPSWLARSGRVRIGTEWLTINQAGRPSAALDFAISPANATASVNGANAIVSVMATPDLPWTATSQANWLTVMPSFQNGAGNGNVVYAVSPNPTMANRSGTIQVAATADASLPTRTHTVSQPAATAMVSADSHTFDAAGETFEVDVTVDDVVNWTISENVDWLSIVGSVSRVGPGKVSIVATGNLTVDSREANVTIAGHAFHVVQKGRTVEVEYESRVFGTETDYATIDVHPDGNVQWMAASSDPTWITIWGGEGCDYDSDGNVIGVGDNTIEYIVADYVGDGTPRTGTITIGDKTVYITQRPYDLSISPSATWVGGNAGTGEVGVPATIGQIWNAIATESWIAIVSGYDEGSGSGTVRFTYADNNTGVSRTGKIIIAGEAYTITQAARQMVAVGVTTRVVTGNGEQGTGNGGVVSGAGTYDRGASITLTATANDGYEFVSWGLPNGSAATANPLSVTADVDKEFVANFRRIPVYSVNGESVREGTSKTFTAPADVLDEAGTTKLVCRGTSRYPEKGASFALVVTEDIDFEWDVWTTNYLVTVEQPSGGTILSEGVQAPATAWLPIGSALNLAAAPDSGKSFFRWNISTASQNSDNPVNPVGTASATSASLRLCVSCPLTISAIFGVFNDTLSTALDAPTLTFTTGGDASWLPVIDATAQTGYTSARSGTIGAESETWLDTTVDGTGTLTFRWRADCEKDDGGGATWDRLAVFTNGVEAARIDGKTDWQTVTLPISGKTTIRWSFYRDDWDEPGATHENAAWVDGIIFTEKGEL